MQKIQTEDELKLSSITVLPDKEDFYLQRKANAHKDKMTFNQFFELLWEFYKLNFESENQLFKNILNYFAIELPNFEIKINNNLDLTENTQVFVFENVTINSFLIKIRHIQHSPLKLKNQKRLKGITVMTPTLVF